MKKNLVLGSPKDQTRVKIVHLLKKITPNVIPKIFLLQIRQTMTFTKHIRAHLLEATSNYVVDVDSRVSC